ncbi:hypothetical protein [Xylophilus sp.]|uniref:hypothetical protein n=1 Tax=Xylophilus sp. TaxID=2653893 RepID=UPI0013B94424|nr:hypothetical protein [Xylophilus sp.]KAF1046024.1 MAG: hypothetical protein GAK38_02727 [Xylophilus sp.]
MADTDRTDDSANDTTPPARSGNCWSVLLGLGLVACALRSSCRAQSVAEGVAAGALLYHGLYGQRRPRHANLGDLPA